MTHAYYHLPGLFEFYGLYSCFLPIYREHREFFYDWCEIGSIYGAPADCIWGGGRTGFGDDDLVKVRELLEEYGISARLTFSNSLITPEHLADRRCNELCRIFESRKPEVVPGDANASGGSPDSCSRIKSGDEAAGGEEAVSRHEAVSGDEEAGSEVSGDEEAGSEVSGDEAVVGAWNGIKKNGVIIYSDLLLDYIKNKYPDFYFVSSVTKVLTDFRELRSELEREDFAYVVPDFRLNRAFAKLNSLPASLKNKVEFLCNECCPFSCSDRRKCYENVSRKNLGEDCPDYVCRSADAAEGYRFSKAMKNPGFIGTEDILNTYLPAGFSNFKIEGRGLGSAVVLEFLLYYLTKPEHRLEVREMIYLDSMLDLF